MGDIAARMIDQGCSSGSGRKATSPGWMKRGESYCTSHAADRGMRSKHRSQSSLHPGRCRQGDEGEHNSTALNSGCNEATSTHSSNHGLGLCYACCAFGGSSFVIDPRVKFLRASLTRWTSGERCEEAARKPWLLVLKLGRDQ